MCQSAFAGKDGENEIVRLLASRTYERIPPAAPLFTPFVAAGFFIGLSTAVLQAPFDPYLPWVFMGEELLLSIRLWTTGNDFFSPTTNVVGHTYAAVRTGQPKFWEALARRYNAPGVHNSLQYLVLRRIKRICGYGADTREPDEYTEVPSLMEGLGEGRTSGSRRKGKRSSSGSSGSSDSSGSSGSSGGNGGGGGGGGGGGSYYGLGQARTGGAYLSIVGLDLDRKQSITQSWCVEGEPPPGYRQHEEKHNMHELEKAAAAGWVPQ
jgi:uncharacterized membrane protein YgcG